MVALGEAMLRLSTPVRLECASRLDVHVAGSEANVAVALAQLGWDATWLSALPDTPLGRRVADDLRGRGVDVSEVRWIDGARVGIFFVEIAPPPRGTTVWYDRAESAATMLKPGDFEPSVFEGVDYAVVGGITPSLGDGPQAAVLHFAVEASARGAKVCVDVNYRPRLWSERHAAPAIAKLLDVADIVVCSIRDAERLWLLEGAPAEMVTRFRETLAPEAELVVLTTGSDGAVASTADGSVLEQAAHPTTIVDRVGAGDAFVGGLLWGLEVGDVAEALRAGAVAAALKCTLPGDFLLTTPAELLQHLAHDGLPHAVVR